jgi:hypothetical protein
MEEGCEADRSAWNSELHHQDQGPTNVLALADARSCNIDLVAAAYIDNL